MHTSYIVTLTKKKQLIKRTSILPYRNKTTMHVHNNVHYAMLHIIQNLCVYKIKKPKPNTHNNL